MNAKDALPTEGRQQQLHTDRSQGSFAAANYMKNTKSRENHLNAKQVMSDSSANGLNSNGSSIEKKPIYQNKSAYKMYS